jgi:uncharacterized protein (DUF58 family)
MLSAGMRHRGSASSGPFAAWLFLTVVFLTAGMLAGSCANLAIGAALAGLLAMQWLRTRSLGDGLQARREHVERTLEGEVVHVRLTIRNRSTSWRYLVNVLDHFRAGGGRNVRGLIIELPAASHAEFSYQGQCDYRRGLFVLGPVELTIPDELGLFRAELSLNVFTDLLVCPRPLCARQLELLDRGTHGNVGVEVVRALGHSEEFAGVRHYREGDPLRYVHWPTSARTGGLYVKEFQRATVTEVTVIVDMYKTGLAGVGAVTSFEKRLRAAATLAASAIAHSHLVRMVAAATPVEDTRLAGGHVHLRTLMQWLAMRAPRGSGDIADVIAERLVQLHRGATLVLVLSSTNVQLESLLPAVAAARRRGVMTLALIVEDRSYYKLWEEQRELFQNAPSLELVEAALRQAGCRVYVLARDSDVVETLEGGRA